MTRLVFLIVALILYIVGTVMEIIPGAPVSNIVRHIGMASFLPLP